MILLLLLSLSLLLLPVLLLLIIFWMPVFCVLIYSASEIPTQSTKKGRFKDRHSCSHEQWRLEPLTPLWKILSYVPLRHFETTNERKPCTKSKQSSVLPHPKLSQVLLLGSHKGKNGWEPPEKCQRIVLQRLVKKRSLKNQENVKQKWGPETIAENGRFLAKTGGLKSLVSFHQRHPMMVFTLNTLKLLFRLSRVLLGIWKCILSGTIKFVSVRSY